MPPSPARDAISHQVRRLVSDPDDTDDDLPVRVQPFEPSSHLATIGRVLMVFKTTRNLPSADAPTWTFSVFTVCVAKIIPRISREVPGSLMHDPHG
jgi:hypothetical protein